MSEDRFKELIRLTELDYERTSQFINGVLSTGATFRGWAVTIWLAALGLAFDRGVWELGLVASLAAFVFMLIDGYHAWLFTEAQAHAITLERASAAYYRWLARGSEDPDSADDLRIELQSHKFGVYGDLLRFRLRDLRHVRQRAVFVFFYPLLIVVGIAAAILLGAQGSGDEKPCSAITGSQGKAIQCGQVVVVHDGMIPTASSTHGDAPASGS